MKRWALYIVLAVVVLAAAGVALWRLRLARAPDQEARSAVVSRGTVVVSVSSSGVVEPLSRVNVVFDTAGRIAEVPVKVGDRVASGDVLAVLDSRQLTLQVGQAQAALDSADARLAQLLVGPEAAEVAIAEANLRAAEAQVRIATADRDQVLSGVGAAQIAAAEADYASALAQQLSAEEIHDRTLQCFSFTLPTGKERTICPALGKIEEQTRFSLEAADKALVAAQVGLDELTSGPDADAVRAARANVAAAEAQRDAVQAQLELLLAGPTEGQIAAAEAQVAQAQAGLEQSELALEDATLLAPFDGVVAALNVTAGEAVAVGQSGATLVDTAGFRVTTGVDELDVGKLAVGQVAEVRLDAFPDRAVSGVIERLAPAARIESGVVTYEAVIGLGPSDDPIRPDMTANVSVVVEELTDVLQVPVWAVRVDELTGQTYVDRQVEDGTERVDVILGVRHEGMAQVLSGISEGDVVLLVLDTGAFGFQR